MTISPVAAPVAVASSGGMTSGSANTDFAALVQQHLGDGSADQGSDERSGGVSGEAAAAMLEAASAPSAVPSDGLAALLAGLLAGPAVVGAAGPGGTSNPDGVDGGATVALMATSGGQARGAVLPEVIPGASALIAGGLTSSGLAQGRLVDGPAAGASSEAATRTTGMAGAIVARPASAAADGGNTGPNLAGAPGGDMPVEALGEATATMGGGAAGTGAAGSPEGSAASAGGVAAAADGPGGSVAAISSGVTTAATAAGATGAAATGATAGTGEAASRGLASNPITDQVFGQVTRLVSRGDGTHRLLLRLHPADLGEVKVVLTVKDGAVDVTLSAGAAAREALREGSPQLRALLELAGATTGQVTVRDLATGAFTSSTNAGQQQPAGTGTDQQRSANSDSASTDGFVNDTTDDTTDGGADGQAESQGGAGGSTGDRLGAGSPDGPRVAAATDPSAAAPGSTAPGRPTTPSRLDLNI